MNLSKIELSAIKGQLLDMTMQLEEMLEKQLETDHREGEIEQGGHDRGDEATQVAQLDINIEKTTRSAYTLRLVKEALLKLDNKQYGQCADCGQQITAQRLLANPIAKRCIDCQARHERNQH